MGEALAVRAQAVGAASQGIAQGLAQRVVGTEALEDEVPEGDQRGKGPLVEALRAEAQPGGQCLSGQQLAEADQ